jgi:two-component system cell cycle response regulator
MTRILVVDDLESHLYLAKSLLEPYGYDVTVAASKDEAIEALQNSDMFDLILSDIGMRKGSGLDLLKAIKSDQRYSEIPVVLISATYWTEADRKNALALGAAKFIFRPLEARAILTEMEDVLPPGKRMSKTDNKTRGT